VTVGVRRKLGTGHAITRPAFIGIVALNGNERTAELSNVRRGSIMQPAGKRSRHSAVEHRRWLDHYAVVVGQQDRDDLDHVAAAAGAWSDQPRQTLDCR